MWYPSGNYASSLIQLRGLRAKTGFSYWPLRVSRSLPRSKKSLGNFIVEYKFAYHYG
jgi:hypothetical protein